MANFVAHNAIGSTCVERFLNLVNRQLVYRCFGNWWYCLASISPAIPVNHCLWKDGTFSLFYSLYRGNCLMAANVFLPTSNH